MGCIAPVFLLFLLVGCNQRFHAEKTVKSNKLFESKSGLGTQEGNRLQVYLVSTTWCTSCEKERKELRNYFENNEKEEDFIQLLQFVDFVSLFYDSEDEDLKKVASQIPWKAQKDLDTPDSLAENECPELSFPCVLIYHPKKGYVYRHNGELGVEKLINLIKENV